MSGESKDAISLALEVLRRTLIEQEVSMGTSGKKLIFFDTDTYLTTGKMDGFSVEIESLVKQGGI